jgi:phosphopantothenoylcysteine synthetase/decarboxylase
MNLLVTAGNTVVPIDRVRCLTNVFTGRTGTAIALCAHERGHTVTLLTSQPETGAPTPTERWSVQPYRTFDDLQGAMQELIRRGNLDAVVHSAAVSDYQSAGIYAPAPGTRFRPDDFRWYGPVSAPPALLDRSADKVKSDEPELWLRLVRTPKLIDRIRGDWAFRGVLVKFKLEVGVSEGELLTIAEGSRRHSAADLMVANTLEGMSAGAYLGPLGGVYERVDRPELPVRLLAEIERLHKERGHG